jgi:hypothetical protein
MAYCPMTTEPALYVQLAYRAPILQTRELGCNRAPISARSVCIAIKFMQNLRNLKLHLTWVSTINLTLYSIMIL